MSKKGNKIKGGIAVEKESNKKWKQSNFFVTINPNVTKAELDPKDLDEVVSMIFGDVKEYIKVLAPNKEVNYDDIDVEYTVEIGKIQSRVHSHVMVMIKHDSIIQLDLTKIRKDLQLGLGLQGIKVQVEVWKDTKAKLRDYIHKYSKLQKSE